MDAVSRFKRDRKGTVALYYQLGEFLKGEIKSGRMKIGEQLLPEDKMALAYGVSRKTIRQMLDKLSKDGYVVRLKAKGTFVSSSFRHKKVISIVIHKYFFSGMHRSINDIMGGILLTACPAGCEIRTISSDQIGDLCEQYRTGNKDVHGLILIRFREDMRPALDNIRKAGLPFVIEGTIVSGCNCVDIDNADAMKRGVEYLAGLGHGNIGLLSYDPSIHSLKFGEHFEIREKAALEHIRSCTGKRNGIQVLRMPSDVPEEIGAVAGKYLSEEKNPPSAFISVSDTFAIHFMKKAKSMGFSIPGDFSIVGFEDSPGAVVIDPPLTTFRQDYFLSGKTAVETLMKLTGDFKHPKIKTFIKPEFIVRQSCMSQRKFES